MSSGIWQRGEEDEGVDGFLITDIRKEVNRAARLVRMMSLEKGNCYVLLILPIGACFFPPMVNVLNPFKHLNFTFR